ncbi:hypothetical protein Hanom_Chr09g00776341 [Helianthus anomalus]
MEGHGGHEVSGFGNSVKVSMELVVEAANLASANRSRKHACALCESLTVKAAMQIQWSPKMRLKMALETEDSSQISWFMCMLYLDDVAWDEPDLLQNMKWVRLWLVVLVLYMPLIHFPSSSAPSWSLISNK